MGYNKWLLKGKYDKKPLHASIHAEIDAILGIPKQDLWGTSLFVYRNKYGLAKPCECCMKIISNTGIKKIFYTNGKNGIDKLQL